MTSKIELEKFLALFPDIVVCRFVCLVCLVTRRAGNADSDCHHDSWWMQDGSNCLARAGFAWCEPRRGSQVPFDDTPGNVVSRVLALAGDRSNRPSFNTAPRPRIPGRG